MPVPQERGFFGSLNTIKTLVESTCEDKWDLLIETALPAAGAALYLLIVPDPGEILENYLQPRGHRGDAKRAKAGHGRRQMTRFGQMRWWQKIGFPDVDSIIAERLPGRDLFRGRSAGGLERWIWQGIDLVDRGLWYWMLLDLADNFVVEWASGIMESRFCTSSFDAMLILEGDGDPAGTAETFWPTDGLPIVNAAKGWEVVGRGRVFRTIGAGWAEGHLLAVINGTLGPSGPTITTTIFIQVTAVTRDEGTLRFESAHKTFPQRGSFQLDLSIEVPPCAELRFQLQTEAGKTALSVESPTWRVTGMLDVT